MSVKAHLDQVSRQEGDRQKPRRQLSLATRGSLPTGEAANVLIHNASVTGLLLETSLPLAVDEELMVDLPEAEEAVVRVVWASGKLFGCQFDEEINQAALSASQLRSEALLPGSIDASPRHRSAGGASFGKKLEQLRKSRSLTMAQVAARLGVSKPTVWAWEKGKARPIDDRIPALAEVLQVEPAELLAQAQPPGLSKLVADARMELASACGVAPEKVRIMVEL